MGRKKDSNEPMSETRKKIHELYEENEYKSIKQNESRARSITVGTAFGGIVEINLRADIGTVYAQMQPTEAIEFIEQLAAGVGVEIAMRPKRNFASWRGWEEVTEQKVSIDNLYWKGAAAWQIGPRRDASRAMEAEENVKYLESLIENAKQLKEGLDSSMPGEEEQKKIEGSEEDV